MKKRFFTKKLSLNKKTISNLTNEEMENSRAGTNAKTCGGDTCETHPVCCPTSPPCVRVNRNAMAAFCRTVGAKCLDAI
ncbi:MAG: class I lanthipeptide [Candidatus Aminicenantes bacterium]|nr:class I lanthipeptide [Candidatus Aminicenantes bacterium]